MSLRNIAKTVQYDDIEDIYFIKSFSKGEVYKVNRLKDKNHWFCTCPGYNYSKKNPKTCKHTQRIKVIDELYKKYSDKIEKLMVD